MKALLACACLLAAVAGHAMRVDNFMLLDQDGQAHELHYYSDASAIVLIVQGNGCPIVRNALPDYRAISDVYAERGVRFLMINSNLQDHRESIAAEAREWDIPYPILVDETQLVGESLGLTRTAEVMVIDPRRWEIVYRGAVNDRLTYERQKQAASEHYLRDALDAVLAGDVAAIEDHGAKGCLINLPGADADHTQISYSDTIAPLLRDNCQECHQPGGIAPWAMTGYPMVRGFAPMIREVLRTKRMPPWHADPHVGTWKYDRGLSVEERQTLVHWVEAGAPRGTGPDPLAEAVETAPEWPLGEPDLIVEIPPFKVAASGVVEYQFPVVANPLDRDVWVRAMAIDPGVTEVVHHVLVGTTEPGREIKYSGESLMNNYLGGYAPGTGPQVMPEGTGVFVPQDVAFLFQMHYTPYGKVVTDRTRMGLYFHDEPPANFLRHSVALNPTIRIPAHARDHEESAYFEFYRDAVLYQVLPHSHYRGKSSTFALQYPDGREELILSVPNYDFNWQRGYEFVEPRMLAAGTRLIHTTIYDNSVQNPGNPDPTRDIAWGLYSDDEMLYGDFVFSWVEETSAHPIDNPERTEAVQTVGFLDRDRDGNVRPDEVPEDMREEFNKALEQGDRDGNGALDQAEYWAVTQAQAKAAAGQRTARAAEDASAAGE